MLAWPADPNLTMENGTQWVPFNSKFRWTENNTWGLICLCVPGATKLEVSNQGRFVVLEVDGSKGLVLGMESMEEEEALSGALRLALGGILINNNKMIVQVGQF